jgi:hypothetical protein
VIQVQNIVHQAQNSKHHAPNIEQCALQTKHLITKQTITNLKKLSYETCKAQPLSFPLDLGAHANINTERRTMTMLNYQITRCQRFKLLPLHH